MSRSIARSRAGILPGLLFALTLLCASHARAGEPVATFSIVGRDPATGEVGVAVQSKFFAVGAVVPWAKAGVGAIATQAFANTTFGPRGLELLAAGHTAQETLDRLLSDDPGREQRQVGIVDAEGGVASFTGTECNAWAGHVSGPDFTAQGNILVGEETVQAMGRAFRETEGMLVERLMAALEAGQAAGGDSRGMQSAAILVEKTGAGYGGFNDRYCDLRVDDHEDPIRELRRIVDLWRVNALILEGYTLVEKGEFDAAIALGQRAASLDPGGEPRFHLACYFSRASRPDEALDALAEAVGRDPKLAERARSDSDLTPIRENSRFRDIVARP
ncbi:MAG: DUF1028 domain-containing protein [Gemmatimonadetes bacterium]|nr:DUF1028 domain-containing protein [Gemmatimonadota bacterium]